MSSSGLAISFEYVSSIKDPRVVEARELASISGRLRYGKALLYGIEQLEWARQANLQIQHIFINEKTLGAVPDWCRVARSFLMDEVFLPTS
jgi:hypothetical protein